MKKIAFCLRDMQLGGVESVLIRTLDDLTEPVFVNWFRKHKNIKRIVLYNWKCFGTKMPRFFLWRVIKHFGRDMYRWWCRTCCVKKKLQGFDVFIDYHDFGFASELKKISSAKKVAWFHSSLNVFIKRKFINKLKFYDKLVVLTDDCKNDLNSMYPKYQNKFVRIYNPIDVKNIRMQARAKCPVGGDYFCVVSRMSYDKDIKTVLDAFDLFWVKNKRAGLVFVGGGDKLSEFERYAGKLKSGKNILFVGTQKNPFVFINGAIANILSSYGEGLPTVLIEASVLGVLNISSDCKYGPREILLDGHGGMLFMPGDVKTLSKYMADVYSGKINKTKMINASSKALNRFDKKEIIKQIKSQIL